MTKFTIKKPSEDELKRLGVKNWGIWTKEVSQFPWEYDTTETFYVLEGEAEISSGTEKIICHPGDLVTCNSGVHCMWNVTKPLKKHYRFDD